MNPSRWTAGHLPPALHGQAQWHTLSFDGGALQVEVPTLAPAAARTLARSVRRSARALLQPLPVSRLIGFVDAAVARLLDPQDPARRELDALLPRVTGFDAEMVRRALTAYLRSFRAPQLHRFVAEDFANPKVLDEFQPTVKGGALRAFGPALLVHHWAGNVPGLPLWSLVCGLLVKAGNLGKLPSAEPVFASVFARVLAQVHAPLGECLAVVWWQGGAPEPAATLHAEAETVLAYGSNATLAQLRAQVPVTTRFLAYGHKLGLALVGRAALDAQRGPLVARRAAQDVARYEQQGCYSPHVVYVESSGAISPRNFAQYLAAELANLERRHPRRALALEQSAAVASWRQAAELRALAEDGAELIGGEDAPWSVAFSPTLLPLAPSAGQRCIQVVAVDSLDTAIAGLAPHAPFLQTAGVAVEPAALWPLAERLGAVGITRVCAIGAMTAPEAGWHHDGRFNLADLVRMVEVEQGAERAAEAFAPYAQEDLP